MNINCQKNTLLFVHIPTHFKEIIRVARLMKGSVYVPLVFFDAEYEGVRKDIAQCESEGIEFIAFFERNRIRAQQKRKLWFSILRLIIKSGLNFLEIIKYLLIPLGILFKLANSFYKKLSKRHKKKDKSKSKFYLKILKNRKVVKILKVLLEKREVTGYFLISCYQFMWNKLPQFLPTISRAAYEYYQYIPYILLKYDIKLMVFPEHNLFYFTQLFVYFGRKSNIPSIIVPFTIANTLEWSEAFYNEPSRSLTKIHNKICAIAFPHWIHTYKARQLVLPVETILLHEMFKITPKNPWLLNSGDIDFLALESEAMKDYYVSAGIEAKYLRATGALYNDDLYFRLQQAETHRTKLYQALNITSNKPMILCALPPDQCLSRKDSIEFNNYEEIVRYIMSELSKYAEQYHIIVNLHPRIKPSTVEYINEYPVKIFYGDIAEVIPLSAVYIASCSATIRMAISCGIPVINYDLYRYRYDDYVNLDGVLTMFDSSEFTLTVEKLTKQIDFYEKVKAAQIKQSGKWGTLDGNAGKNLLAEIDLLFSS